MTDEFELCTCGRARAAAVHGANALNGHPFEAFKSQPFGHSTADYRQHTAARELAEIPLAVAMLRTLIGHGFMLLAPRPGAPDEDLTSIEDLIQEIHDARAKKG